MPAFFFTNVPYRCQWADRNIVDGLVAGVSDAREDQERDSFGFSNAGEYEFWARRTCGLACLESYLTYMGISFPNRASLVDEALETGAYIREPDGVKGLLYRPFLSWILKRFDIKGTLMEGCDSAEIATVVQTGAMVMCSVSSQIRDPRIAHPRRGGHLVLVHGADCATLRFHNPSGYRACQENVQIEKQTFDKFFAHRGIALPTSVLGGTVQK